MANPLLDIDSVKTQMMALWSDTFGDSDDYVNLIFDAYFNPDLVKYHTHHGSIVAAMMGIPFYIQTDDRVGTALYLCGLVTRPEFRRQGIMTEMIGEMHDHARRLGFDYSFLIPADDHLRKYYEKFGYQTLSYRYCSKLRIEAQNGPNVNESKIQLKFVCKNSNDEVVSKLRKCEAPEIFDMKVVEPNLENSKKIIAEVENSEKDLCEKYANKDGRCTTHQKTQCGPENLSEISKNAIFTRIARIEYFEKCIDFSKILHSRENLKICLQENKISGGEVLVSGERSFMVLMPDLGEMNGIESGAHMLDASESDIVSEESNAASEFGVALESVVNGVPSFEDMTGCSNATSLSVPLWYAETDMELIDLMEQAALCFPYCTEYRFYSYLASQLSMLNRIGVVSSDSAPISTVSAPISIPYGMILPLNASKARKNATIASFSAQEVYLSLMLD
jgi:GNAT superfamily N-acetyltransferase